MIAVKVDGLTKRYRLYDRPVNRLKEILFRRPCHREFVALEDIGFSVDMGETLGIIGENGAGKTTLLKILSRTLVPSSGTLELNGVVTSLLELGSGFHPEFTGMENIFFYSSLLGIDRTEMQMKKDEIIAFSELGDFIHYPIKTYSSGMFVRLAFSVVTAVDPDILIIDEVLSVGDLHFQKKSTDRILSFKERGKTIVFCSHEMYHVARICDRAIWLKHGKIEREGAPFDVIQEYETYQLAKGTDGSGVASGHDTSGSVHKEGCAAAVGEERPLVFVKDVQTYPSQVMRAGGDLYVRIQFAASSDQIPYRAAVVIKTPDGLYLLGIGTNNLPPLFGNRKVTLHFPKLQLKSGTFIIEAFAFDQEGVYVYDKKEAPALRIPRESIEIGIIDLPHTWTVS